MIDVRSIVIFGEMVGGFSVAQDVYIDRRKRWSD
jgi:hypothetical protein